MRYFIGIDPGASGAMAMIYNDTQIAVGAFKKQGIPGYASALKLLIDQGHTLVIGVEKVGAMTKEGKKQGVVSASNFGRRIGEIHGMLITLSLGFELIPPKTWQSTVKAKKGKQAVTKQHIYEAVNRIYPAPEVYFGPRGGLLDGVCDSVGIAHHMRSTYS
jgi:hypothetical protein